jgi:hypothetical protein
VLLLKLHLHLTYAVLRPESGSALQYDGAMRLTSLRDRGRPSHSCLVFGCGLGGVAQGRHREGATWT